MAGVKLWVDDTREEPSGWMRAKSVKDAAYIMTHYQVEEISLDYDLKYGEPKADWVLRWIVKFGKPWGKAPEVYHIHTENPKGREVMGDIIRNEIMGWGHHPLIGRPKE